VALNATSATTLPALIAKHAAAHAHDVVLRKKQRGIWMAITWGELAAHIRHIGLALLADGETVGNVVAVLSDTRPEAAYADLGALSVGCVSVCLPTQDDAARTEQALRDTDCRLLFVENEEQLDKALLARDRCPTLRRIVIFDMKGLRDLHDPMCTSLSDFVAGGAERDRNESAAWESAVQAVAAGQPAAQTPSGTTLTHGELLHLVEATTTQLGARTVDERVAFLPMSGMMERALGLYAALITRTVSNYLENAETLTENIREVRPTVLGAPPSVWALFRSRIVAEAAGASWLQRTLYRWAISVGEATPDSLSAVLGRHLVLRCVRHNMGLSRLRIAHTGTAAPPPDLARWYRTLGIALTVLNGLPALDTDEAPTLQISTEDLTHAA
jgi:long-chain acyl-CoA synthetase